MRIIQEPGVSSYYELTPPERTRFTNIYKYNFDGTFLMQDFKKSEGTNHVRLLENFNEYLVILVPRIPLKEQNENEKTDEALNQESQKISKEQERLKEPEENYDQYIKPVEDYPRIKFKIKPIRSLQNWIFVSQGLGYAYILYLILILIFLNLNAFNWQSKQVSDYISGMVLLAMYQVPWIFGLIIGNQLWLKEPRFLWKKQTISSYLSIILAIILLVIVILLNNYYCIALFP